MLEATTIALNQLLYAQSVGLSIDEAALTAHSATLAEQHAHNLASPDLATRYFALESWSEARRLAHDQHLADLRDQHLTVPHLTCSEGLLTWRNWKAYEREHGEAGPLQVAFDELLNRSQALVPALTARLNFTRQDFATQALTPAHTFAFRENVTLESLRAFLLRVGHATRELFQESVNALSQQVFQRPAGPAELRALYLNRMYEPLADLFTREAFFSLSFRAKRGIPTSSVETPRSARSDNLQNPFANVAGNAAHIITSTQATFQRLGFDLRHLPVDAENRPNKYPGAFCYPIATPGDVRVSVRIASPHHLIDMLYHEFGHALHFSGIRPDLPFIDRYWIHSGVHETFSTLFETLLHDPLFLREQFDFDEATIAKLVDFGRFKFLLIGAWLNTSALTALDAWLEGLTWPQIETRYAEHFLAFSGIPMPGAFARLEPFIAAANIYPAGYVMAMVRVTHWLKRLRALGGEAWWQSPLARADVWERIHAGGAVQFPVEWLEVNMNFFSTGGAD